MSQPQRVARIHTLTVLGAFVLCGVAALIGYRLVGGIGGALAGIAVAVLPFAVVMPLAMMFDARRINRRDHRGASNDTSNES